MSDTMLPGQPIPLPAGPTPQLGRGIYVKNSSVRASLVGAPKHEGSVRAMLCVFSYIALKAFSQTLAISRVRPNPPSPNSVVLGSITRLSPTQALLSITVVDGVPLPPGEEFTGVIRSQDVRATEKDKVKIGDCFRGGDVVRGLVISLGDARSYFVTTARNDLGVIFATSEAGETRLYCCLVTSIEFGNQIGATMEPVSWQLLIFDRLAGKVADMLTETRAELDDFHTASKELEAELESELARTEKAQQELKIKVARAEGEKEEWKSKFMSLQTTHNSTTTSLQRELDKLRQDHQKLKIQFRELEMGNDDLERTERAVSSSLADVEAKYSRALEEKILLEHELMDKANLEEQIQRLKDELRDANEEISILKDQLSTRSTNSSNSSLNTKSLPQLSSVSSEDDLLHTPAPSDLQLSELEASTDDTQESSPEDLTPKKPTYTTRNAGQSALLQHAGFQPGKSAVSTPPGNSGIPRSNTLPSMYSSSPRSPMTPVTRPNITRHASTASHDSTASTTTSKSKGVQMVSEMRARVKNLEQKIHTRVPRLRLGSMTNRSPATNGTSSPFSPTQSTMNKPILGRSSWDKQLTSRRSNDTKRSTDSESEKGKRTPNGTGGDSSGWVLIMEDSPSPPRDRRRVSSPSRPRSFNAGASTSSASTASSPTPESSRPSSLFQSTAGTGLRRPQSRLSGGSTTTASSIPTPTSRPATPTFLPLPSGGLPGGKRSTGPGVTSYLSQPKRSSLGASTTTPPGYHRDRPVTLPAPGRRSASPNKALPHLPNGHENVTLRTSRLPPSSSSSSVLSKSRIGRPSGGRRSSADGSGGDPISRPRSGSAAGP
ncbi:NADH:ubiquinone oxidoreductase [Paramarasmius palmivorus]|uniref:NADH:ubiquinone oxidoreductase n=1 Tax=Paramarasmius palmivorus TaxID=297713 RepID=A0AAW0E0R8_9AGAR